MWIQVLCVSIFALIFGASLLFLGYRYFFFLLPFWGFFAGFGLGAGMVTLLFGGGLLATATGWIMGFVVGLIFAALSYLFYFVGVALVAGSVGYALGAGLVHLIFPNSILLAFGMGMVGAAVIAAITLVFNLQKYVIIAVTSSLGATAVFAGLFLMFGRITLDQLGQNPVQPIIEDSFFWGLLWLVIMVVGIGTQIQINQSYILVPPENQRAF